MFIDQEKYPEFKEKYVTRSAALTDIKTYLDEIDPEGKII
jgi:hypothetical protein